MKKQLNLEKVHWLLSKVSNKYYEDAEGVEVIRGIRYFTQPPFDTFIEYFSFKFEGEYLVVFNNDPEPYEDWTNNEFIYIPLEVLYYTEEEVDKWVVKTEAEVIEKNKLLKQQEIEQLKSQRDSLDRRISALVQES